MRSFVQLCRRFLPFAILIVTSCALTMRNASGQAAPPTPDIGFSPASVYDSGEFDNVNPVNGNLFINLPLFEYPQKGGTLKFGFRIVYNDKRWYLNPVGGPNNQNRYQSQWVTHGTCADSSCKEPDSASVQVLPETFLSMGKATLPSSYTGGGNGGCAGCGYNTYNVSVQINSYYVATPDGSHHFYGDNVYTTCNANSGGNCPQFSGNTYPEIYLANDGSGFSPQPTTDTNGATAGQGLTNVFKDRAGTRYEFTSSNLFETITDTSGNQLQLNASGWTDSLGHTIKATPSGYTSGLYFVGVSTSVPASCPSQTATARRIDATGVQGSVRSFYLCYRNFPYQTSFNVDASRTNFASAVENSGSLPQLSAIVLPNGKSYLFDYDSYLSLKQLTLPTGAVIAYQWQNLPFVIGADTETLTTVPVTRALRSRSVYPSSSQSPRVWTYSWYAQVPSSSYQSSDAWSVVTDPNGNDTERHIGSVSTNTYPDTITYYTGCSPHDQAPPLGTISDKCLQRGRFDPEVGSVYLSTCRRRRKHLPNTLGSGDR